MALEIPKAKLKSYVRHVVPGALLVTEYLFSVPLDYGNPSGRQIQLFARGATKYEVPINPQQSQFQSSLNRPWFVFLQGGPGFGNPEPQDSSLTRFLLNRGYQLLFLDYRGVGLSTPVTADTAPTPEASPEEQFDYLKFFRQVDNVRDCEAVRKCLTENLDETKRKWSIFGQSFGGFVCLSYLSQHPKGLNEVFMTGGLAPISKTPDQVYRATFQKVFERNMAYYRKFPEDVPAVRRVAGFLHGRPEKGVRLPGGGLLTARRLLTVGHMFGLHGGLDNVHSMILRLNMDLEQFGFLTRPTLLQFESYLPFDTAPIYAVLHEAIYCCKKGVASDWAAQRVGQQLDNFRWLDPEFSAFDAAANGLPPLCFSGEMIFPFMFDDYPELQRLRPAAEALAKYDSWDDLYDEARLRANQVPVYAASFVEDMYVESELARDTARRINLIRVLETNTMYHNALRARPDEVLPQLFKLRDDAID